MSNKSILLKYGGDIIESELFCRGERQKHHFRSNVASHSINTALFCILFYKILSKLHIEINIAVLVVAALAHDLGIIGRDKKFSSNYRCLSGHPKDSVKSLHEIVPDADEKVCDAIQSHMFPLCTSVPNSKEAWILSFSDKCASFTDFFKKYSVGTNI